MPRRIHRGERGAFLLVFALCLTLILTIVAMTVDLGQARLSKRDEQQLADLASISAGRQMAGYGAMSGGVVVSRPRSACTAAMASIDTNSKAFNPEPATIDTECGKLPETSAGCTSTTSPINATVVDDPYAVTVRWPIPDSELVDVRFLGTGANDGTDQCARFRTAVQRTDDTAFAGVIGVGSLTTSASAVVRSTLDSNNTIIPAFLVLERFKCDALSNSANGADSYGIQILGIPSTDQPGTIHVDSAANSGCGGGAANSVAVYGTPLSSGDPSIFLHPAPVSGDPGTLYVVATTNPAKSVPDGINTSPQPGDVVSRAPLNEEFASLANPAVQGVHGGARTALATDITSDVVGDGWKRLGCSLEELAPLDTDDEKWYVRCDSYSAVVGQVEATATLLGATPERIVFDGDVAVATGEVLDFATTIAGDTAEVTIKGKLSVAGAIKFGPLVENVYVGGGETYKAGKNESSVSISGSLQIRSTSLPTIADDGTVSTVCPTAPQVGRAEFAVFGDDGPNLDVSGNLAMCNTMVYLGGATSGHPFAPQSTTSGGGCSVELPCPKVGSNVATAGYFELTGLVDWTAPHATAGTPPSPRGIEDLLFWSESDATADVKAGAKVVTQGIFVGPNLNVEFRSPALGEPRNAQFIARRLELLQGTLYMLPNPNDSTPIPAPGSFAIIR